MALGRLRAQPPPLQLLHGAASNRLVVYREGLLLAPRSASRRAERGVAGRVPSPIRLDAFERMVAAELASQLTLERTRPGVLTMSAKAGAPALQRGLRFARMLGLSGWETHAGSFARLCDPAPSDLSTLLAWLRGGETTRVTLLRGRDALDLTAPVWGQLELSESVVDDCYAPPSGLPRGFRPHGVSDADDAVWRWARATTRTVSLDVWLSPPTPLVCVPCVEPASPCTAP